MGAIRRPVTGADLSKATSQRNNSQWAPLKELATSPAVLSTAVALSSLPPVTPWTAGLKILGVMATTAILGDLAVDALKSAVTNPNLDTNSYIKPSNNKNSPSGGDHFTEAAKALRL